MRKLDGWADFHEGPIKIVLDEDVYQYIRKHTTVFQRMNPRNMVAAYIVAFLILSGSADEPKGKFNLVKEYYEGN